MSDPTGKALSAGELLQHFAQRDAQRLAWRHYARAALASGVSPEHAVEAADRMVELEAARFDADPHFDAADRADARIEAADRGDFDAG